MKSIIVVTVITISITGIGISQIYAQDTNTTTLTETTEETTETPQEETPENPETDNPTTEPVAPTLEKTNREELKQQADRKKQELEQKRQELEQKKQAREAERESREAQRLAKEDARKNLQEQNKKDRCEQATSRIETIADKYDVNHNNSIARFMRVVELTANLIEKLETQGIDATELQTDLDTLNDMIVDFSESFNSFIEQFKASQTLACGDSEGDFKTRVDGSKELLSATREKAKAIQQFIQNTLKADVEALRSTL